MAADASIIQADANRQNSPPKSDWHSGSIDPIDAPRAVREYLNTFDDAAFGAAWKSKHHAILELTKRCLVALRDKTALFVCPTCGKGNDEAVCEGLIVAEKVPQTVG